MALVTRWARTQHTESEGKRLIKKIQFHFSSKKFPFERKNYGSQKSIKESYILFKSPNQKTSVTVDRKIFSFFNSRAEEFWEIPSPKVLKVLRTTPWGITLTHVSPLLMLYKQCHPYLLLASTLKCNPQVPPYRSHPKASPQISGNFTDRIVHQIVSCDNKCRKKPVPYHCEWVMSNIQPLPLCMIVTDGLAMEEISLFSSVKYLYIFPRVPLVSQLVCLSPHPAA